VGDEERSPGGSEILRHEWRDRGLEPAGGDPELVEAISDHLDRYFGVHDDAIVLHEMVSDLVHVDVHIVPPEGERSWTTLVTSGMAERPMTVPEGLEDHRHAELVLALPADWPLDQASYVDEANYWPVRLLKQLARLPHEFETYLGYGHTIPNGDPPEPYAETTSLCCACILPPLLTPEGFERLETPDGRTIHFYALIPLHEDEMNLKLKKGADALMDRFDAAGVTELLDPRRPSVGGPRRGLFRR